MRNKLIFKKLFSCIFLFIFFVKILITLTPLITEHFDPKTMHAIIMQLEIENSKGEDTTKDSLKKEYVGEISLADFSRFHHHSNSIEFTDDEDNHLRTFYPSVPTPPPNC